MAGTEEKISTRELDLSIYEVVDRYSVIGVRQLFYQLVSAGYPKTEKFYKRIINRVVALRKDRSIPWQKIEDAGRNPITWDTRTIEEKVKALGRVNVDHWQSQAHNVEVWIEKAGLVGVIQGTCSGYRAPVMAARGFPSWSCLLQTANRCYESERDLTILYAGDYDASGVGISDGLHDQLEECLKIVSNTEKDDYYYGPYITVRRIALTPDQIVRYNLPERPHKESDTRTAKFVARTGATGAVELDALDPNTLNIIIERALLSEIEDEDAWGLSQNAEKTEQAVAKRVAKDADKIIDGIRDAVVMERIESGE